MTLPAPRQLDQYVTTETGPLRTTLLWTRVSKRMGARRAPVRGWHAAAFAVAVAAAILLVVHHEHRTGIAPAAPTAQSTDSVGVTTLADGSRVRARPGGHVRIDRVAPTAVEVTLESGAADFDVVHDAARTFVVHTGRFDVSDLGTRFSVSIDGGLRVSVSEGRVEIRDTTGALPVRILARGESWSASTEPDPAPSGATAEATAAATASASRPLTAKELMEQADAARVAGRAREAAALFDTVRRKHRSDPRAAMAAFQLGRMRLDTLDNPQGAVEALDDAVALGPSAPFREDAESRRVEALDRARDPRCREARDTYLARYPAGIHVREVSARCAP
jgi:transmembrane sensor